MEGPERQGQEPANSEPVTPGPVTPAHMTARESLKNLARVVQSASRTMDESRSSLIPEDVIISGEEFSLLIGITLGLIDPEYAESLITGSVASKESLANMVNYWTTNIQLKGD